MTYEMLDAIADSYIPLLLVLFLAGLLSTLYTLWPRAKPVAIHCVFFMGLLSVSYGLMFLDSRTGLWPYFHLDYSTHTAVALTLVVSLCTLHPGKWIWLVSSFIAYILLMLYQQYHSLADILSTAFVVGVIAYGLFKLLKTRLLTTG